MAAFTFQTIHAFSQAKGDGGNPLASVVFDSSGNLYGTTSEGGTGGCGIAYELSPPATQGEKWTETILHNFGGVTGCGPSSYLIFDQAGTSTAPPSAVEAARTPRCAKTVVARSIS